VLIRSATLYMFANSGIEGERIKSGLRVGCPEAYTIMIKLLLVFLVIPLIKDATSQGGLL